MKQFLALYLLLFFSIPSFAGYGEQNEWDDDYKEESIHQIEIGLSSMIPVGRQQNIYGFAPTISLFAGFPFKENLSVDVGLQIGIPVDRDVFILYHHGYEEETKSKTVVQVGLRLRHQHNIARNVYINSYFGLGYGALATDLEKCEYDGRDTQYYNVESIDIYGGASIRYKHVGLFAEYHYVPYGLNKKVDNGFGGTAVNIGVIGVF